MERGPYLHRGLPGHRTPHLPQVCPQQQLLREQQAAQPGQSPACPWAPGTKAQSSPLLLLHSPPFPPESLGSQVLDGSLTSAFRRLHLLVVSSTCCSFGDW